MGWISSVTAGGLDLLAAWMAGCGTLSISARCGDGTVPAAQMAAQTDVTGDSHAMTISHCAPESASGGTVLRVDAKAVPERNAYALRQVGLFARLTDAGADVTGEILIALYQSTSGNGINVPSTLSLNGFSFELSMALCVGTDDALSIELDPYAAVSEDDLEGALAAHHPNQLRFTAMLYTTADYSRHGIAEWKSPGTTWTAGQRRLGVQDSGARDFTAPEDKYACAIKADVTGDSAVMESWLGYGDGYVSSQIEYETLDGWIFLTSATMPASTIGVGFAILV